MKGFSKSDKKSETEASSTSRTSGGTASAAPAVSRGRTMLAQVIWLFFLLAALFLAVGALLIALDANPSNDLVEFVKAGAEAVDLGVFDKDNGILKFTGANADTKNALVNWGLGAVAWLVVGRILERIIRP